MYEVCIENNIVVCFNSYGRYKIYVCCPFLYVVYYMFCVAKSVKRYNVYACIFSIEQIYMNGRVSILYILCICIRVENTSHEQ